MQLYYQENGEFNAVDGQFLKMFILRNDLVPIPVTIEADIRIQDESLHLFGEGCKLQTANGDEFTIIKSKLVSSGKVQGTDIAQYVSIIAVISSMVNACFIKDRPIRKVKTSLSEIYRSIGCTFNSIEGDFAVPVYNCLVGEPPSFQIAQILQENAGVMSWRDGKLRFIRVVDLFKQEPLSSTPIIAGEGLDSGFLERFEVPSFYSIDKNGAFIYGNKEKARTARFIPNKDLATLRNMSTCLVLKQISRIAYNDNIVAGDLLRVSETESLVVITVAHVFSAGIDGDQPRQYTKLWLGELYK